ncbi:MAG: YihY/virulence factor BrkB family protein [Nevskiales bacterium]|nr:YihY/virulence factor BrkB family protein [Nevskiales bacterium]
MNELIQRLNARLWSPDLPQRYPRLLIRIVRYLYVLVRDLIEGQLSMRAMSLIYTTLLSIVPLLALAFSVLKALGAHNSLEPVLLEFLRPLGPQADQLTANIIHFVENIRVGVLGSLGVALLMYSAVSMIQKVEASFNYIWRIEHARPISQRLGEYFAVLTLGPVAVFSALGITASVLNSELMSRIASIEPFGLLIYMGTRLLPYLLIVGVFTLLYSFMPNTRVRFGAAAAGGLFAGFLWQSASAIFASFVASATNYNAIYSGFAIVIFLLIWLYVGWLILLMGCQLSFYVQHPEHLKPRRTPSVLSSRVTEYLALMIMGLVGRRFIRGDEAPTQEELALCLNAEPEHVARVVDILMYHHLLVLAGDDRTRLLPGMDLDSIRMSRLWRVVRAGTTDTPATAESMARGVSALLNHADEAFEALTDTRTLRQWILEQQA